MTNKRFDLLFGSGKHAVLIPFKYGFAAPINVHGREIQCYQIPKQFRPQLVEANLARFIPPEGGVASYYLEDYTVFIGMLEGKIIPCCTPHISQAEALVVAAEMERRIQQYGSDRN